MTIDPSPIQSLPFVDHYIHLLSIDSTNTYAKTLDLLPAQGITVVHADVQTAGRGQRSNSFFSFCPGGLYVSIITPIADIKLHFVHNRAMSLAIATTLSKFCTNLPITIKWPNDIYCGDKKLCGILLESMPAHPELLIVGFGINLTTAKNDFPAELQTVATSIAIESGLKPSIQVVLGTVLSEYRKNLLLPESQCHEQYKSILYRKNAAVTINGCSGTLHDVAPDGRLCIKQGQDVLYFLSGTMQFL